MQTTKEKKSVINKSTIGAGVFISTTNPSEKMVKDYISLIQLDVNGDKIVVEPNLKTFKDEYRNEDLDEEEDSEFEFEIDED